MPRVIADNDTADITIAEPPRPKGARCSRCRHWGRVQDGDGVDAFLTTLRARFPLVPGDDATWKLCDRGRLGYSHGDHVCEHFKID